MTHDTHTRSRHLLLLAGAVVTATTVVHAAPALTALDPVRRHRSDAMSGVGAPGHVALTFDDGPDVASTPSFIRSLDELGTHATFFLLGRMLNPAPWLGRELVEAGHEVALHGWDHRVLLLRGPRSTYNDMARAHDQLTRSCGAPPAFYRPPYGVMTRAAHRSARALGMTPVLWSTWGRDWRRAATADSVCRDVFRRLGPGGTILLHDSDCTSAPNSWRTTLAALPGIVAEIRTRGLEPGPLREHGLGAQMSLDGVLVSGGARSPR